MPHLAPPVASRGENSNPNSVLQFVAPIRTIPQEAADGRTKLPVSAGDRSEAQTNPDTADLRRRNAAVGNPDNRVGAPMQQQRGPAHSPDQAIEQGQVNQSASTRSRRIATRTGARLLAQLKENGEHHDE